MKKHHNILRNIIFLIIITSCSLSACKSNNSDTVTIDNDFKDLFYADSNGITGADGIFSVLLPDGSTVFFLGDCFLGNVSNGSRKYATPMLRNAFNVISPDQKNVSAIYQIQNNTPQTLMTPTNTPEDTTYRWYWPGHGFVKEDTLYVFALNLYNEPSAKIDINKKEEEKSELDKLTEDIFAFRIKNIDLLSFTLPDFNHIETHKVDFDYKKRPIDFGNCVLTDGKYVYIYGTENLPGFSQIHTARVPLQNKTFYNNWEYSTGNGWDKDLMKSQPIDIDISVSEQFSIFKHKKQYILLTQERAGLDIYTYTSSLPHKGFQNKTKVYHTPETDCDSTKRLFTYNALAHPQFTKNNKLLVSYCINSKNVKDVFDDVEKYRARFIRVPIEMITNDKSIE